ncbi:putative tRNA-splicing endonuclease positive effector [Paratrimastix pyriformis]|uniref:tRNA-splicing endonuclease positive effector n=1 Tax=Paratrimastix pyriformis TaxID=342808 RepID=A0ABQ8UFD1_9EUKA|nr:putative tRNA-splicing endonuclease positive effector [Paratrimastix pyriformis]
MEREMQDLPAGVTTPLVQEREILLFGQEERIVEEATKTPLLKFFFLNNRLARLKKAWSIYNITRDFFVKVLRCLQAAPMLAGDGRSGAVELPACFGDLAESFAPYSSPTTVPQVAHLRQALETIARESPEDLRLPEMPSCWELLDSLEVCVAEVMPGLFKLFREALRPVDPTLVARDECDEPVPDWRCGALCPIDLLLPWTASLHVRKHQSLLDQLIGLWAEPMPGCPYNEGALMDRCRVLFCTLSTAGRFPVRRLKCPVAVVDEAAQVSEAYTTVLFSPHLKQLILVGDPMQLPSLTLSPGALRCMFGRSLMERLVHPEGGNHPCHLLRTQYRMHPAIASFPNQAFYNGLLFDAESVYQRPTPPWEQPENADRGLLLLPPVLFLDSRAEEKRPPNGHSFFNDGQIEVVMGMVKALLATIPKGASLPSVGIIAFYAAQVERFQKRVGPFLQKYPGLSLHARTVDGFQGGEDDVIFLSTVRSNGQGNIGFTKNPNRMNVALTRARQSLVIVGSMETLAASAVKSPDRNFWGRLLDAVRIRSGLMPAIEHPQLKAMLARLSISLEYLAPLLRAGARSGQNSVRLLEDAPWTILFSEDALAAFTQNLTKAERALILDRLVGLVHGPKVPQISVANPYPDLVNLLHPVNSRFVVLWAIDVDHASLKQVIRVLNLVPHTHQASVRARLEAAYSRYTPAYMEMCRKRIVVDDRLTPAHFPHRPDGMVWYALADPRSQQQEEQQSKDKEAREQAREQARAQQTADVLVQEKFFRLQRSDEARALVNGTIVGSSLLMQLSEEERAVINSNGTIFAVGRSGTGKTTILLYRMYFLELLVRHWLDGSADRQSGEQADLAPLLNTLDEQFTQPPTAAVATASVPFRQLMLTARPAIFALTE